MTWKLAGIVVLAVIARLVWCEPWRAAAPLTNDPLEYVTLAEHLRFDGAFSYGGLHTFAAAPRPDPSGVLRPTADRAPLFPAVIALLWGADRNVVPLSRILIVNGLAGAMTALLTALVAGRIWSRAAIPAGLAVAVWPLAVASDAAPLSEALYTTLVVLTLWLWQQRRFRASGLSLGLAALTRLPMLPMAGLVTVFGLVTKRRGWATAGVIALLVIAPWTARNLVATGRFVPIGVAGSGCNFLFGTIDIPLSSGGNLWGIFREDPEVQRILAAGQEDDVSESAMRRAGLARIAAHPGHWLILRVSQLPRILVDSGGGAFAGTGDSARIAFKTVSIMASVMLLGAAAIGAARLYMIPEALPVIWTLAYSLLLLFPLYADRRFNAPLIPLYIVLAVCAWMPRAASRVSTVPSRTAES
jgi:hypothetical protein